MTAKLPAAHRPRRLTRIESQAQTRAALLAAARSVLIEYGISAASVELIAERAGYSKGALYSNFESKEAILIALMREHLDAEVALLHEVLEQASSLDDLLGRLDALYAAMHAQPGLVILSTEFQLLATRNALARQQYLDLWLAHRDQLATMLRTVAKRLSVRLRSPAQDIIDALAALTHGLVLQAAAGRPGGAADLGRLMLKVLRDELVPRTSKTPNG